MNAIAPDSLPQAQLIEHLLQRYHARHREQLPELIRLASRVEQVHGHHLACPNGLADLLRDIEQELEGQGGTGAVPDAANGHGPPGRAADPGHAL